TRDSLRCVLAFQIALIHSHEKVCAQKNHDCGNHDQYVAEGLSELKLCSDKGSKGQEYGKAYPVQANRQEPSGDSVHGFLYPQAQRPDLANRCEWFLYRGQFGYFRRASRAISRLA